MKLLWIVLLMTGVANASELRLDILEMSRMADDDMYQVNSWEGLQLSYQFDSPVYVFGSYETASVYPMAYSHELQFLGLGLGVRHKLTDYISLFGQFGYYFVSNDFGHQRLSGDQQSYQLNEGAWQYLNTRFRGFQNPNAEFADEYGAYLFEGYEIVTEDTIGGTVGVDLLYPVGKDWTLGMSLAYRHMTLRESIIGYFPGYYEGNPTNRWEVNGSRNYSTIIFAFNASMKI